MTAPPIQEAAAVQALTLADICNFAKSPLAKLDQMCVNLTKEIDQARFNQLDGKIAAVEASIRPSTSPKTKAQWETQKSRLKGKLFEDLIGMVLDSASIFETYQHIQTNTNEIDWLVVLGSMTFLVRPVDGWGPHFICECKMRKKALDTNWISRLNTLLQTQTASVAILFTAHEIGNRGNSGRNLKLIQDVALSAGRYILRVSMEELRLCVTAERNLLHLLSEKYLQLKTRSDKLKLIYG